MLAGFILIVTGAFLHGGGRGFAALDKADYRYAGRDTAATDGSGGRGDTGRRTAASAAACSAGLSGP